MKFIFPSKQVEWPKVKINHMSRVRRNANKIDKSWRKKKKRKKGKLDAYFSHKIFCILGQ